MDVIIDYIVVMLLHHIAPQRDIQPLVPTVDLQMFPRAALGFMVIGWSRPPGEHGTSVGIRKIRLRSCTNPYNDVQRHFKANYTII